MSFISSEIPDELTMFGKRFYLNLAFDVVLEVYSLFEEHFSDMQKINLALKMLISNRRALKHLSIVQKNQLLTCVWENYIQMDTGKGQKKVNQEKLFDFNQDGEYIYSSFFMDYGIDLIELQGKLHWRKFIALFQGLSEKTKIKEIMAIRGRKIPPMNNYNQEEIQNLRELKSYYALNNQEENYEESLGSLFNTLEKMAVQDH